MTSNQSSLSRRSFLSNAAIVNASGALTVRVGAGIYQRKSAKDLEQKNQVLNRKDDVVTIFQWDNKNNIISINKPKNK